MIFFKKVLAVFGAVFAATFSVVGVASSLNKCPAPFWTTIADIAINPQNHIVMILLVCSLVFYVYIGYLCFSVAAKVKKGERPSGGFSYFVYNALIAYRRLFVRLGTEVRREDDGFSFAKDVEFEASKGNLLYDVVLEESTTVDNPQEIDTFDKDRVKLCLKEQELLRNVKNAIVDELVNKGRIVRFSPGEYLLRKDEDGESAYFILQGEVCVVLHGKEIARRGSHECVGEMAILDQTRRRMADIRAAEYVVALEISRKVFGRILEAQRNKSHMIFNMAKSFADRLRVQVRFHKPRNEIPRVFIGSSKEAAEVAKALEAELRKCGICLEIIDWADGSVFRPSLTTIECLERLAPKCDFAIMVLSGDDRLFYRGETIDSPRDNVVFELGLFMGAIGRERSWFVVDSAKIPTDLDGATYLSYSRKKKKINLSQAVGKIVASIKAEGTRCA